MTTTSCALCGICEVRHMSKAANFWCLECDEGLCLECNERHSISKSSRQHNAIPIERYNKLPPAIAKIVNYCTDHGRKFENYCPEHQQPCCAACISADHKSCTGLLLLQDVIKTAKTSALLDSIEVSVKDIQKNFRNVIEDRQKNLTIIHEQRQKYDDEIEEVRTNLNCHLDTLKQEMLKEMDATESKAKIEIEQLLTKLLQKEKMVDDLEHNISTIKLYATDFQVYFGSKSIETEIQKEQQYLQSLIENGSLNQIRLQRKINYKLSNIRITVNSFGTVTIEKEPPSIVLIRETDKQAQTMSVVPQIASKSVDEIKLSQIAIFTIKRPMKNWLLYTLPSATESFIKGITGLPDGGIVLADCVNRNLVIVNKDGIVNRHIPCSNGRGGPFDVAYIKDHEVAVSTTIGIQIIDIHSETNVKLMKTNGECHGIAYNNGTLVCCVQSKGIQCIQISNKSITTLVNEHKKSDQSIAVQGNKIYGTSFSTDVVSCYTFEGTQLWQFKDISVMNGPTGIVVDNNSNVYVASYKNNRVIVLSSDGEKYKNILTFKDGLDHPRALHFDETTKNLFVANEREKIYVYQIS